MHQVVHFQASNLYGPPCAYDNNPHQKEFAGTDVYSPFHQANYLGVGGREGMRQKVHLKKKKHIHHKQSQH